MRGISVTAKKGQSLYLYKDYHALVVGISDYEKWPDLPSDCPLKNEDPIGFDSKAISMKDMEVLALKVKSKHFIMVFDSCFSGSLFNVVRAAPVDISEKSAQPVRQFITAGGAGEQVPDQSVFKVVFLQGISGDADLNADGYVTGSELGMHLQEKVVNYSRGRQHPQYGKINNPKLDRGDFIFMPPKAPKPDFGKVLQILFTITSYKGLGGIQGSNTIWIDEIVLQ